MPESRRQKKNQLTDSGQAQPRNAKLTMTIMTRSTVALDHLTAIGRPIKAPIR